MAVVACTQACVFLLICLSEAVSTATRNYYETIDVEPTATDRQIKKAFHKLALKFHPDKNGSADAEKTFREIAEAYTVLSNREKRRLYDTLGHKAFLQNEASVEPEDAEEPIFHFSFSDQFQDLEDLSFGEESHLHWSFPQDWEDEDGPYEYYSFEGPAFGFHFGVGEENEEEPH